jgi:hypothetical protein
LTTSPDTSKSWEGPDRKESKTYVRRGNLTEENAEKMQEEIGNKLFLLSS